MNKKYYILEVLILIICTYIGNKLGGLFFFLPLIELTIFLIIKENISIKQTRQEKENIENSLDNETEEYIEKQKSKTNIIECKVCGKEIPYNEYRTCEECHQKILGRLSEKNQKHFCMNCGKEIKDDWNFCNYCGYKLNK